MTDLAENALAAKRVGQYLIDAGVLTAVQLDEALERQQRMSKAGFHVLLGTILEEMGAIDRQSLEAIILRQRLDEGSVNLGPEVDWSPFRAKPENSFESAPEPVAETPFATPLSPAHAAEAMDAFFGSEQQSAPDQEDKSIENGWSNAAEWPAPPEAVEILTPVVEEETAEAEAEAKLSLEVASFVPAENVEESVEEPAVEETAVQSESSAQTSSWREESLPRFPFFGRKRSSAAPPPPVESMNEEAPMPEGSLASSDSVETDETDSETAAWAADLQSPVAAAQMAAAQSTVAQVLRPESPETETDSAFGSWSEQTQTDADDSPSGDLSEAVSREPVAEVSDGETGPVDINGFKFSYSVNGLSQSEVSAVIGQLIRRTKTLEDQMEEAKENLSHLDSMRRYGEQSVKAADTIAQQIRDEAETQAVAIRDRAQLEARKIVSDARSKHDEIVRTAGTKAKDVSDEIAREIEEHRKLNETFQARAQELLETDTSGEE